MALNDIIVSSIQIFAVLNPISIIPVFLAYTHKQTGLERQKIVAGAIGIVAVLSVLVVFTGQLILDGVGITVDSFRLAGGILLLITAIDMFGGMARGKRIEDDESGEDSKIKESLLEMAAVPLATPLLLGPGSITLMITFSYQMSSLDLLIGVFLALGISGVILALGNGLKRIIGDSGIKLLSRLMSLIVASVAIEFIHTTLVAWGIAV